MACVIEQREIEKIRAGGGGEKEREIVTLLSLIDAAVGIAVDQEGSVDDSIKIFSVTDRARARDVAPC